MIKIVLNQQSLYSHLINTEKLNNYNYTIFDSEKS